MAKQAKVVELKHEPEVIPYESAPPPKARLRITVEGIEPLMTHSTAAMRVGGEGGVRGSRIPKPEDEAEAGTYRLEDGTCAIKAESFIGAIAGKYGAAGRGRPRTAAP